MGKSENKTKPTNLDAKDFINALPASQRKDDALELLKIFERVTKLPPRMWGASMIGFGRYAYKYDSGREGEYFMTGFSPRAKALTVYVMPGYRDISDKLNRLGKHKTGKSCLYINKLADIDIAVLEEILADGIMYMRANYQTWDT